MKTRTQVITESVVERLTEYTAELPDDYFVFDGRRNFEEVDLCKGPHLTVFALSETVEAENDCLVKNKLIIRVEGHAVVADHDAPAAIAYTMAGHTKQAVFSTASELSFPGDFSLIETEYTYPSDGSDLVFSSVEIAVIFTEPKTAIFIN